jgi:hypothetical protein
VSADLAGCRAAVAAVFGDYMREAPTADTADLELWAARMAATLGDVLAVLDDSNRAASLFPAAAVQMAEIRLVLDVFDWKTEDGQRALELIADIANGRAR